MCVATFLPNNSPRHHKTKSGPATKSKAIDTKRDETMPGAQIVLQCKEHYHRNHTYKSPALLLLLHDAPPSDSSNKEDSTIPIQDMTKPTSVEATPMALHALIGDSDPRSFHLQGTIRDIVLQIIVDSNTTLNFIHPKMATPP